MPIVNTKAFIYADTSDRCVSSTVAKAPAYNCTFCNGPSATNSVSCCVVLSLLGRLERDFARDEFIPSRNCNSSAGINQERSARPSRGRTSTDCDIYGRHFLNDDASRREDKGRHTCFCSVTCGRGSR